MKYLGIIRGTNIVAGVVDENYAIIAKAQTKTNVPRPEDLDVRRHGPRGQRGAGAGRSVLRRSLARHRHAGDGQPGYRRRGIRQQPALSSLGDCGDDERASAASGHRGERRQRRRIGEFLAGAARARRTPSS